MRYTPRPWIALVMLAFSALAAAQSARLPAEFRRGLEIVPVDAESLIATVKPFSVPKPNTEPRNPPPFDELAKWHLIASGFSGEFLPLFSKLEGKEVTWAITAKRRQEVRTAPGSRIIELGVHPYESVTIARFRGPVPDTFIEALRGALEPPGLPGISGFRSKEKRFAVLLPEPDLLVSVSTLSTDDAMLVDVVRRLAAPPQGRVFDAVDRPWRDVDTESTIWGIRKTKNAGGRPNDSDGREWVVFSFKIERPRQAVFRSLLAVNARPGQGNPWLGLEEKTTTRKDLGLTARVDARDDYVDTTLECLPELHDRCLILPFFLEALGVMVWI